MLRGVWRLLCGFVAVFAVLRKALVSFVKPQNVFKTSYDALLVRAVIAGLRLMDSYAKLVEQFIFREVMNLLHASTLCAAAFAFARY